jgi:acyl-CoA thioesterase
MSTGADERAAGAALDGVSRFLGFRYAEPGVVRLDVREDLLNPGGLLSGAVTYALVDYAMGSAVWATLAEQEGIATLSIAINYLRTAREGEITGRAQVDRRNRTAATLRATVEDGDGRLLATAIGSYSIFPRSRYAPTGA